MRSATTAVDVVGVGVGQVDHRICAGEGLPAGGVIGDVQPAYAVRRHDVDRHQVPAVGQGRTDRPPDPPGCAGDHYASLIPHGQTVCDGDG
jgi:hypothetical protein